MSYKTDLTAAGKQIATLVQTSKMFEICEQDEANATFLDNILCRYHDRYFAAINMVYKPYHQIEDDLTEKYPRANVSDDLITSVRAILALDETA